MISALAAVASSAQAKQLPAEWTWTDYGPALRDVSCSSPGHCAGVGQRGMVLRSTSGGDDSLAWSRVPLEYPEELDGVTCTGSLCLAVSNTRTLIATYVSKVFRSTDGGSTWSDGVLCGGAVEDAQRAGHRLRRRRQLLRGRAGGGIWRSVDGGGSWEALELPSGSAAYEQIDCPAAGVCVAAGNQVAKGKSTGSVAVVEGTEVTSVDLPEASGKGVLAVGCDTATSCTATDGLGHYMSLAIPKKKFESVGLFPKVLAVSSLSCPKQGECVGLAKGPGGIGVAVSSTNVGADNVVWKRRPIGSTKLAGLSCVGDDCVAVGGGAGWFAGSENGRQWKLVNEVAKFEAIQCESLPGETCVAGGKDMIGLSGTGGKFWSQPMSDDMLLEIKSLDCNGKTDCLFLGKTMTLFSKDLVTFEGRHPTTTFPSGTDAQTCITHKICVGAGAGVVYTTLDGAESEWTQTSFPGKAGAIGCVPGRTAPAECVVTLKETEAMFLGTMTHDDGKIRWNWRYVDADPEAPLAAVSCGPGGECTAVGAEGQVLSSQGTDLMHWNKLILPSPSTPVGKLPAFESVSCPADGDCLVGGLNGNTVYISSTKNDWSDWTFEEFEGIEGEKPTISAFGCETVDRCVGVGGTSLVGVRK